MERSLYSSQKCKDFVFDVGHSPVDARGGQLQIAGVVVGQWGANTQSRGGGRGLQMNPQRANPRVMSVGPGAARRLATYNHGSSLSSEPGGTQC